MHDRKQVEVLNPTASYELPKYRVTENGLENCGSVVIRFVKGAKNNPKAFRQEGVVTESLVTCIKTYLEENNVDHLKNDYTDKMIEHLQSVLDLIDERATDRAKRNVQDTYNK